MKKILGLIGVAAILSLTVVACSSSKKTNNEAKLAATATHATGALQGADTAAAPALRITAPKNGDTIDNGDVTVKVDTDNFKVVDKRGQNAVPGEGHLVYYIDTVNVPTVAGRSASGGPGAVDSADKSNTWPKVPAGNHTFAVQLVSNDGTPLNPPIFAGVAVTVK